MEILNPRKFDLDAHPYQAFIYAIRNKQTGQVYVGQTRGDLRIRISSHRIERGQGKLRNRMYQDITRLGIETFEAEILECVHRYTMEQLDVLERDWIKKLNALEPNGYNRTAGNTRRKDRNFKDNVCDNKKRWEQRVVKVTVSLNEPIEEKAYVLSTYDSEFRRNFSCLVNEALTTYFESPEMKQRLIKAYDLWKLQSK